ncbi:MAG: ATP-dependent helicase, partial [Sulfolobales archaeon]
AGTSSPRQFVQRLGRLLRPSPGKVARLYEIITKGTAEELHAKKRKDLSIVSEFEPQEDRS